MAPELQSGTQDLTAAGDAADLPLPGSARHAAWLYTAADQRKPLAALFALERAISESARAELAHEVAHARLQWWQHESQQLARGCGVHPLSKALQSQAASTRQPPPDVQAWTTAVGEQLARVAWLDRPEFTAHCQRWSESIWLGAAALLANAVLLPNVRAELLRVGNALRELELLGRLASDARAGRVHLPLDELQRCKAATSDCYAQPWPAILLPRIDERLHLARRELAQAANSMPPSQWPALRGMAAWIGVADRQARRMQRALPLQWQPAHDSFTDAAGDAWSAWRAARGAQSQRPPLRPVSN